MNSKTTIIATIAVLAAVPAWAGRIMSTPFAETPKDGGYKITTSTMDEARSTDMSRAGYRLDLGLTGNTELGINVSAPENRPTTTQFNLQQKLVGETASHPTVSVGIWDVGHIDQFSGAKTGGSFFVAASKTIKVGDGHPPVKLSLGAGTNKLDGLFGGVVAPINSKVGVMVEYLPKNSRLPGADAIDAGVYYYTNPNTRLRLNWSGGNPGIDIQIVGAFH